MPVLKLESPAEIGYSAREKSPCYRHAMAEICRLLKRAGVATRRERRSFPGGWLRLQAGMPGMAARPAPENADEVTGDAYILRVDRTSVEILSREPKGILNGVYDLAEQLGFFFLLPGEDGEWAPSSGLRPLPLGTTVRIAQFPWRGVFWESGNAEDYPAAEWLKFYAKLRFNALSNEIGSRRLCEKLGLRLEVGGHGFARLLPRELFAEHPELFRMMQPVDFKGQRMADSNLCVTSPAARELVRRNFAAKLADWNGVHAVHAWPDDLPAGGWCLCPTCRSYTARDQAMLAMKLLAEAIRARRSRLRIPWIAYHDTMMPGTQISPPPESFLLFAPRERCYGHALDDPNCARNQFYLKCLQECVAKFRDCDDAHSFEYYFDQILFRGIYPYLPDTIIADMRAYRRHGIKSHLSLQVAGPELAPEFNMLVFARAAWDESLTADQANAWLASKLCPECPAPWRQYLARRAEVYRQAMLLCDHDIDIYLDYRWLPQTTSPFGQRMVGTYARAARLLASAAAKLAESAARPDAQERLAQLVRREVARAHFESAELTVMSSQQRAMNAYGAFLDTNAETSRKAAAKWLRQSIADLAEARQRALAFGLSENSWYLRNINRWLATEMQEQFLAKLDAPIPTWLPPRRKRREIRRRK